MARSMTPLRRPLSIRRYDFRQPNKFSREQLRILKTIFENWGKASAPQLSAALRLGVEVGEVSAEEMIFSDYYASLDTSAVGVIDPDRLPGAFLISLEVDCALAIYDRVLGSNKGFLGETRDLTEIETSTVEMLLATIIENELPPAWEPILNLAFKFETFGPASNFIGVMPLTESCVIVTVPMLTESINIYLQFCLPYPGLESLVGKLNTQEYFNRRLRSNYKEQTLAKRVPEIPVDLVARLATLNLSYEDVQHLHIGAEIPLPVDYREKIEVYIDQESVYDARPHISSVDGRYLFRISEINAPAIEKMVSAKRAGK
jgi:flagellar motor switch protein FliM